MTRVLTAHQLLETAASVLGKKENQLRTQIGTKNGNAYFMSVNFMDGAEERTLFFHNTTKALGYCNNGNGIISYVKQYVDKWIAADHVDFPAVNMHDDIIEHIVGHLIDNTPHDMPNKTKKAIAQKVKVLFNRAFIDPKNEHLIVNDVFHGLMKYLEGGVSKTKPFIRKKTGRVTTNNYLLKNCDVTGRTITTLLDWKVMQTLGIASIKDTVLELPKPNPDDAAVTTALKFIDKVSSDYSITPMSALYLLLFLNNYNAPNFSISEAKKLEKQSRENARTAEPAVMVDLVDLQSALSSLDL